MRRWRGFSRRGPDLRANRAFASIETTNLPPIQQ
jgi:hypothetical protein